MKRDIQIVTLLRKMKQKRLLRRVIAFLSVIVLLVTVNTLKFEADTLEHVATCGFEEHSHEEACFDENGALSCALTEHAHTDACFQNRPVKAAETDIEQPVEEMQTFELDDDAEDELNASAVSAEAVMLDDGIEASADELDTFELSESEAIAPDFAAKRQGYTVGSQYPFLLSDVIAEQGLNISIDDVTRIEQLFENDEPDLFRYELMDGDIALYPTADFELARLLIYTDNDVELVELLFGIAPTVEPVPDDEIEQSIYVEVEEKAKPIEPDEESEPLEESETVEKTETIEETVKEIEEEAEEITEEETETEEVTETVEIEAQTETEEETETVKEIEEEAEEITEEETETVEENDAEQPEENDGEAMDETQPEEIAADVAPAMRQAEATVSHYAASIDLSSVDTFPIALDALMAQAERVMIAEAAQSVDATIEPVDVNMESIGETIEPAVDEIEASIEETTVTLEDVVETQAGGEVSETLEPLESEAIEPMLGEITIELGSDEAPGIPSDNAATTDDWALDYDAALLSIERADEGYMLSVTGSFEQTVVTVNNGEMYVLTLLNGAVRSEYPAATFSAATEHVVVNVEAPEGAFPAGTTMVVTDVEDEDTISSIAGKVEEGFVRVERVHAVDITFLNADGVEIEPLIPISVTMSVREIEAEKETVVVHVDHDGEAQIVAETTQVVSEAIGEELTAEADTALAFVADAFSVYAVVVGEKLETMAIAADGNTYRIEVTFAENASLPAGAALAVSEVTDDNYLAQVQQSMAGEKRITMARFFDIKIMNGDEEIQPDAPVMVKVALDSDAEKEADAVPCAVHFTGDEISIVKATEADEAVSFRAESFSVWGVVYTVDFHNEADGEAYTYTLTGGGAVRLSDIVTALHLAETNIEAPVEEVNELTGAEPTEESAEEQLARFMDAVASVTFSDPGLVWVGQAEADTTVGELKAQYELKPQYSLDMSLEDVREGDALTIAAGDWALISLLPFDTEETLTIEMNDGRTFVLHVTDAKQTQFNYIRDLDGKSFAIVCNVANALLKPEIKQTGRLTAESVDPLNLPPTTPQWLFEMDPSTGKFKISCNGQYLRIEHDFYYNYIYNSRLTVSSTPQWLTLQHYQNQGRDQIKIVDDYGYAVDLSGGRVNNGFQAYKDGDVSYECFYLYHLFYVDGTKEYVIYTEINGTYYVLKMDGTTETRASLSELDKLSSDYKWKVNYLYAGNGEYYYNVVPVNNSYVSLALNDELYNNPMVQGGRNNVMISEYEGGVTIHYQPMGKPEYYMKNAGENFFSQPLNNNEGSQIKMHLYEQRSLDSYELTVETEDVNWGHVSGYNNNNQWQDSVERFTTYASPTTANGPKTNAYEIRAVDGGLLGSNGQYKYIFDYWTLNGARVGAGKTIGRHTLEIPESGLTLTAHYKRNPSYVAKDEDKHGKFIDKASLTAWLKEMMENQLPLDPKGCSKTAEVYDYENRIYRVDLTSKSSLSTFDGTIDLGFIIDVSASMKFPSKINYINKDYALCYINNGHESDWLTQGQTYYIIADETGTATVCQIEYRWDSTNQKYNWQWKDASKEDSAYKRIEWTKDNAKNSNQFHASDATDANWNKTYKIYQIDPNDHHDRKYYLENSISNTITTLQGILNVLKIAANSNNDPDVDIAWNTFMNYLPNGESNGKKSRQPIFTSALNDIKLEYSYKGGTSTDIALLDAVGIRRSDVSSYNDYYKSTPSGSEPYRSWDNQNYTSKTYYRSDGQAVSWRNGTPTNVTDPNNYGLQWEDSATKYAVLITDGAPQRNGNKVNDMYVKEAAKILQARGITLLTVGLSMGNVDVGRRLLYDIASTDAENDPYFYEANSGDELEYVLYSIIETIMQDCSVFGDVTDTVGEAFYPVDLATGAPLKNDDWIDINGNKVSSNASNRAGKIIATTSNGKTTYQVKWTNQEFSFDGWHGTVYVKAKEDFLGGDIVKTNKGEALIEAKQYQIPGKAKADLKTGRQNVVVTVDGEAITNVYDTSITMKSPRVNVNELNFTENSTEWTVYVGTEVEPLPQIKALYDQIKIEEVVTANDSSKPEQAKDANSLRFPVMASESDDRTPAGTPVTFYLKDLITKLQSEAGQPTLDWNELIRLSGLEGDANTGITFRYDIYTPNYQESIDANDRDYPSTINIKLVKDHDPAKHITTEVGDAVETYTLKVKFAPDYQHVPVGQNGDGSVEYHTGTWGIGSPGTAAGTETSTNNHIVNIIKRIIELKKTNMDGDLLKEAKFKIYRKNAQEQEIDVATVTTENGIYIWNWVEPAEDQKVPGNYWKDETVYYIRETEAPTDHQKYDGEITVKLSMDDIQTYMVQNDTTSPYDWTQTPTLEITGGTDFAEYVTVSTLYEQDENAESPAGQDGNAEPPTGQGGNAEPSADQSADIELPELGKTVMVKNRLSIPIGIDKTDTFGRRLAGASFRLVKDRTLLTGEDYSVVNKAERNEEEVSIPISDEGAFVIPVEGVVLRGLGAGDYTLTEVSSPDGYIITLKPITFTIAADGVVTYTNTEGNSEGKVMPNSDNRNYTVQNEAGARLPATGGSGTAIFTAAGLAMIALAAFLLLRRKAEY